MSDGDSYGFVTDLEIRQPTGMSHDVAYEAVRRLAERLQGEGWDVTLRPTLPDVPVATSAELRKFLDGADEDTGDD